MKRLQNIGIGAVLAGLLLGTAGCSLLPDGIDVESLTGDASAGSAQTTEDTAEQTAETAEQTMEQGPVVRIDGRKMKSESILQDDTVMISAEEFCERMDAEYTYDAASGDISMTWNDRTAELKLGKHTEVLNGEKIKDEAPLLYEDTVYIPAEPVAEAFAADAREHKGKYYITPYAGDWDVPAGYTVPVLEYHAVSDDLWGGEDLFVSPSNMEEQLKYLTENGYTTITFEDLYRIDEIEKPVMLTFDDGYDDNYENLYPLLQKYNCKATIFMISGRIGSKDTHKMTAKQLREMSRSGLVSIQSHTYTHEEMGTLSRKEQKAQMKKSAEALLECTGKQPFVLCYPFGSYNEDTLDLLPDYFHFGILIDTDTYVTDPDSPDVPRHNVSRYCDLSEFASFLS